MASYAIAPSQTELKLTLYNREVYAGSDINRGWGWGAAVGWPPLMVHQMY